MTTEEIVRYGELRQRETDGALSEAEIQELTNLIFRMDREEIESLAPTVSALGRQRTRIEAQNHDLTELIRRKEALARRMQAMIAEFEVEHRSIREEEGRILAGTGGVQGNTTR